MEIFYQAIKYLSEDPLRILMIVGGTGGLVYWWDRWRYRTRVQIRDIKISKSQDNQHSMLSFEAENLGHSPTSIQSAVIVMGCGPKKERFRYTFTITSGDRNLPPNMPKTFVAQRPLVFEIVALWYRTHIFRLTRGRKVCVRLLALNVAHYKAKYGELPLEEHQAMLEADDIDEEMAKLLASGVLEMVSVLALVTGRSDETEGADDQMH